MKLKGFKTIILALLVTIIGALEGFGWADIIPDNIEGFILPIIGLVFGYLRTVTNTAIGKSV